MIINEPLHPANVSNYNEALTKPSLGCFIIFTTFGFLIEAHEDDENDDESAEKANGGCQTGYELARALHVTQLVFKAPQFHPGAVVVLPHSLQLELSFFVILLPVNHVRIAFGLRFKKLWKAKYHTRA